MKSVRIATLKDQLSRHLRAVEKGASFVVTDRDHPIAQLLPVPAEDGFELLPAARPFRARTFAPTRKKLDSTALLMKERGSR